MAWQSFWLAGWDGGGFGHTQPVSDTFTAGDTVVKAAGRTSADGFAGTDSLASQWDAARALADIAALADQADPARSAPTAHEQPVDDTAQATDLIGKHLVALRPPRPDWENP